MKILLVDDNKYILESLQQKIDYASLGFTEVYTAKSMKRAVKILTEQKISAVITDIEMPNGTGLELLEWINCNQPSVVTVFCTSYADFNYAKKAVELHSFDYYLKPVQYQELYEILERVVAKIKENEEEREKQQFGDYWIKNLEEQKNYFWTDVLLMIYTYAEEELGELAVSRYLPYRNGNRFTICIAKFAMYTEKTMGMQHSLKAFLIKNILEELLEHRQLGLEAFFKNNHDLWILVIPEQPDFTTEVLGRALGEVMEEANRVLGTHGGILFAENELLEETRSVYLDMEREYLRREKEGIPIVGSLRFLPDESEFGMDESDSDICQVKMYIDAHYCEKIRSEEIGGQFYYNTIYLTRKFKKIYGKSIGGYLLEKRIERAKELLEDSELGVSQVAIEVGYDNFSYFSRLFKKKTGYAPKDYRKLFRKTMSKSENY